MIFLFLSLVAKIGRKAEPDSALAEPPATVALHVLLDARRVVNCLHGCTAAPGRQWRTLARIVAESGIDYRRATAAVGEALRRGWIETRNGDVCLTDLGRQPPEIDLALLAWPASLDAKEGSHV
jgi:hypothetical protein